MGRSWGHGPHSFLSQVPEPSHLILPASGRFPVLVRQRPLLAQVPRDSGVLCCGMICAVCPCPPVPLLLLEKHLSAGLNPSVSDRQL